DRSVDLRHRAGGQGEVGQGCGVLVRGVLALGAQSVEGVEGLASGAAADLDDDVDVGGEVRLGAEDRDHAAVASGHVPGPEVQSGELDSGGLERGDEFIDL